MSAGLTVCVLGLGEAGGRIAADLAGLGVAVRGWDPRRPDAPAGVEVAASLGDAVAGSDVVLSLNAAAVALDAAAEALPALRAGQLYVDANSGGSELKWALAEAVAPSGALFVDAALLGAVPKRGLRTRWLAAGPGAELFRVSLAPLGAPIEVVPGGPGAAAVRKLLRSVFMKGIGAAAVESMAAAEAAGCAEWLHAELAAQLTEADGALLDRLLDGTRRHAGRRVEEVRQAAALLRGLGVEPHVAAGAAALMDDLKEHAHVR